MKVLPIMRAEIKPNRDDCRQKLADILPLPAPFTVYIEPTRFCNLKCSYCIHATRDDEYGPLNKLGYKLKHMPFKDGMKILDDLSQFPKGALKRIVFSGLGEPLANPRLPEIITAAVKKNMAERVELITNGLLLTKELSRKLIATGLTNTNISIQGLTAKKYKEVCGKEIAYEVFIENLQYLYSIRGNTRIYIKIIDFALENPEDKETFYEMFGEFTDKMFVEHLIQMQQSHEDIKNRVDAGRNFYGERIDTSRKVCSPSFYYLQVGCDLDVFPCPLPGLPKSLALGNARKRSLLDIWHGSDRFQHLKKMLTFQKNTIPTCAECVCYDAVSGSAEYLDDVAPKILGRLEKEQHEIRN